MAVSASKHRTTVVTDQGDVYMWEDDRWRIVPKRVTGIRRVMSTSVGEKHSLALVSLALPPWPPLDGERDISNLTPRQTNSSRELNSDDEEFEDLEGNDDLGEGSQGILQAEAVQSVAPLSLEVTPTSRLGLASSSNGVNEEGGGSLGLVSSLQFICQSAVAKHLVEPRSVLQLLEYADAAGATMLRSYCVAYTLQNLDVVLHEARSVFECLPNLIVQDLERSWRAWLAPASTSTLVTELKEHEGFLPPLMGSSPIGSTSSSLTVSASWTNRSGQPSGPFADAALTGSSPATASGKGYIPSIIGGRRRLPLQPGRRPTAAPPWMAGQVVDLPPPFGLSLDLTAQAALGAIGHTGGLQPGKEMRGGDLSSTLSTQSPSGATRDNGGGGGNANIEEEDQQFASRADVEADAARSRLLRQVRKKLQQAESLSAQRASGAALDAQQLAKLGQWEALSEALAGLEAGIATDAVQMQLAQSQELAAKLTSSTASIKGKAKGVQQSSQQRSKSSPLASSSSRVEDPLIPVLNSPSLQPLTFPSWPEDTSDSFPLIGGPDSLQSRQSGMPIAASVGGCVSSSSASAIRGIRGSVTSEGGVRNSGVGSSGGASKAPPGSSRPKDKPRKGGLSMFLSGDIHNPIMACRDIFYFM